MRTQEQKMRMLIAEQAAEWHVAHLDGGLDSRRAREFMRWLQASPLHIAEYLQIASIARDAADAARKSNTPLQSLLMEASDPVVQLGGAKRDENFETYSPDAHRVARKHHSSRHTRRRSVVRWAASFAALVFVLSASLLGGWLTSRPHVKIFATRHGEQRSLQLSDDTTVQLDSDSSIKVEFNYRQRRVEVERGQAYFQVAKDSGRPFSVRAGQSLIRDVGTAFDVYRRSTDTTVTVAQGRVQVWTAPDKEPSIRDWFGFGERDIWPQGKPLADLVAGHQVRIALSGRVESQGEADMQQTLAWTRGDIAFDNQSVASVAAEFNRYNRQQIDVADSRIGALPISGVFNAHDVGTFATFLGTMSGVHVETHGQQIVVAASKKARTRR